MPNKRFGAERIVTFVPSEKSNRFRTFCIVRRRQASPIGIANERFDALGVDFSIGCLLGSDLFTLSPGSHRGHRNGRKGGNRKIELDVAPKCSIER